MNINQTALKLYLDGKLPKELIRYFMKDFAQIVSKIEQFKKKNNQTPSLDFLLQYSSKMGQDKEQSDRIENILYVVSKIKDVEMSVEEVGELFLDGYKSDMIRDLIKRSSTAIIEENMILVEKLSKEIADISSLSLGNNQWLETDIKDDIKHVPSKLELVSTGIFKDNLVEHPFSNVPVGSLILILARSGRGKSTLTLQSAINLYLEGKNVLNINVELQKPVILGRIKSNITGIPLKEISSGQFLTEDAETLNKIYDYVMEYKLELEDGLALVKKIGLEKAIEKFEALPRRGNILKIISATDKATQDYAKSKGMKVEKLPNDVEILQMLEDNGEYFDAVYIDLVSELKFTDSSLGGNIAINPVPQPSRLTDPRIRNRRRGGKRVTLAYDINVGMGPWYSETIDDNADILQLQFGVKEFNSLVTFWSRSVDYATSVIVNTGRSPIAYTAGNWVGTAAVFMAFPVVTALVYGVKDRKSTRLNSSH